MADPRHSALEIDARLEGWQRRGSATIQQLNRWIDIQSYRDEGRWISSMDRRRAADRLVLAWRRSLGAVALKLRTLMRLTFQTCVWAICSTALVT